MNASPEAVLIGAAILDVVAPGAGPRVFETGSLPCPGLRLGTGGDAMNEAVVLARLGRRVRLVSRVGDDAAGDLVLGVCRKNGIDVSGVARGRVDTGVNVVLVGESGERCFLTNPEGSLRKLTPEDVFAAIEAPGFAEAKAVCFASVFAYPLLMPALEEIFRRIREKGPVLLVDMTRRKNGETLEDIAPALQYADYVLPNLDEAHLLTGTREPAEIARQFLDCGVKNVIVKLGADGCLVKKRRGGGHRARRARRARRGHDGRGRQFRRRLPRRAAARRGHRRLCALGQRRCFPVRGTGGRDGRGARPGGDCAQGGAHRGGAGAVRQGRRLSGRLFARAAVAFAGLARHRARPSPSAAQVAQRIGQGRPVVTGRPVFEAKIAAVTRGLDRTDDVFVVELAKLRLVPPRRARQVDVADTADIARHVGNDVPLHDLHVVGVVEGA